jgi:hypothetical protein
VIAKRKELEAVGKIYQQNERVGRDGKTYRADANRGRQAEPRAANRIAAALALIRQSYDRQHGLAVWLSHSGMDHDPDLLDKLAARAGGGIPGVAYKKASTSSSASSRVSVG